jgi:hypothetical protein
MAGYSSDVIRDFAARFGSIAKAEEEAQTVPGFGEEIRRIEAEITSLSALLREPPGARERLEDERRRLVVEALREEPASRRSGAPHAGAKGRRKELRKAARAAEREELPK